MKAPAKKIAVGAANPGCALVSDDDYFDVLGSLVRRACDRVCASLFLIDMNPRSEYALRVHDLLIDLKNAQWEGCDVRLIISGSKTNMQIAQAALTAVKAAAAMGLPAITPMSSRAGLSHAKYVVADDYVLLGSHNWSPGTAGYQTQDSVLLRSPEYASYCGHLFDQQWRRIKP